MVNLISSRIVNMSVKHLPPVLNVISWSLWYFHLNCRGEKQEMQKKHNPAMWCMEVNNKLNIKPKWPPAHPHTCCDVSRCSCADEGSSCKGRSSSSSGYLSCYCWGCCCCGQGSLCLHIAQVSGLLACSRHSRCQHTKMCDSKKNLLDLKWTVVTVSDWCDQRHRQTTHWSNIDIWYQGDGDANKFGVIMVSI